MNMYKVVSILSIICMSVNYAAQEQNYSKQLQAIAKKYSVTQQNHSYVQKGAKKINALFLQAQKAGKEEAFTTDLIALMKTDSDNMFPLKMETYFYMFNQPDGSNGRIGEKLPLIQKLKPIIIRDIKPFLTVEGLLKAYTIFSAENVNYWLLREFPTRSGNALVTENIIQNYLAKNQDKLPWNVRFALSSYIRDYHIFNIKPSNQPSEPAISEETVQTYTDSITKILKENSDNPEDLRAALLQLYKQAVRENNAASLQKVLVGFYEKELQGNAHIPGPVMTFCTTLLPHLKKDTDKIFKKGLVDAWQNAIKSNTQLDEQKLVDMFNFLSQPKNARIISEAQMISNHYVDAVVQSIRIATSLQNSNNDLSIELHRIGIVLGGAGKSNVMADALSSITQKLGIGITAEDTERDSKDQSDSDLFDTYPRVWYLIAHKLLDAAKTSDQISRVEKVLKNSRKKGRFTAFKDKLGRWLNEYGALRNLQLKWKSRSLQSNNEKYDLVMKEIVNTALTNTFTSNKIDPSALCLSVSVVLKTLTNENVDDQPGDLLKQLQQIDGITPQMIHDIIIDRLPQQLQRKFISALSENYQGGNAGFELPGGDTAKSNPLELTSVDTDVKKPTPTNTTSTQHLSTETSTNNQTSSTQQKVSGSNEQERNREEEASNRDNGNNNDNDNNDEQPDTPQEIR